MATQDVMMGRLEMRALFALEEAEAKVISAGQLAKLLKISSNRANKLAWQLTKKKRLIRIRKGFYLFAPLKAGSKGLWSEEALALASQLLKGKPYYIGFWTALNRYGMTEQIPWVTQVVVTKRLEAFEAIGTKYEFIKVGKLGEWQEEKIAGEKVRLATREQLILDCLAHPEYCGGIVEVAKALWNGRKEIDWKKLEAMVSSSKQAVAQRLGFLLETLGIRLLKIRQKPKGWRWLDTTRKKEAITKSQKWKLLINLDEKELVKWKES